MRILVIDDETEAELAIAAILRNTGHVVVGARDPRVLPELLAEEEHFDVAMVDMVFLNCPMTGLGALRTLRDRSPGTKLIVRCADEENRLLHLIAAFSFFEPIAMESKGESAARTRELLLAVQEGGDLASAADHYRFVGAAPAPLDALLRNKTDLTLWQMLARFDKRPDIARASFVSLSTVDHFIADKYPAVEQIRAHFGDAVPVKNEGDERQRHTPLIRLASFAWTHRSFFGDPDLEGLLTEHWQARRRTLSESSAAVRETRPRIMRRSRKEA